MVQKKIIGTLGIWLLVSAMLLQSAAANTANLIIVGIISAISGLTLTVKKSIEGWIGAVLGIWLIISAFIPSLEIIPCKYCNAFIIGAVFIVIGFAKIKEHEDLIKPFNYNNKIHSHRY